MDTLRSLLSSRVKSETLRLLFGVAGRELHVRELARQAHLSDATVRQELRRLSGLGVVESRRDGNRAYYRANPRHPLYPELRGLVLKTSGLVDLLRRALVHPRLRLAFVFGSVAALSEGPESDVDLLVLGDLGLRELSRLLSGVAGAVGRTINPHIMTAGEFARRRAASDHFLAQVMSAPKLFVVGNEDELAAMGG